MTRTLDDRPPAPTLTARFTRIHYQCMLCGHEPAAGTPAGERCPRCGGNLLREIELVPARPPMSR